MRMIFSARNRNYSSNLHKRELLNSRVDNSPEFVHSVGKFSIRGARGRERVRVGIGGDERERERESEGDRRAVATSAARFNYTLQTHDMSKSYTSYRLRHLLKVSSRATVLLRPPPSPLQPSFPRRERIYIYRKDARNVYTNEKVSSQGGIPSLSRGIDFFKFILRFIRYLLSLRNYRGIRYNRV